MKRSLLVVIPLLTVSIGIASWVIDWSHRPSTTSSSNQSADVLGESNSLNPFDSMYFQTQILSNFQLKRKSEDIQKHIVGSYLFSDTKAINSDQLAITVGLLGNDKLSDTSAIALRRTDTQQYKSISLNSLPQGGYAFERISGEYEKSVFWNNDRYYASVVISGTPLRKEQLDRAIEQAITNWQWLK